MKFFTLRSRPCIFFSKSDEGGGAPKDKPKSMEEQLSAVRAELADLTKVHGDIVIERDALKSERDSLKSQFDSLSAEAVTLRADLTSARETITTITSERDTARKDLSLASDNVSRLEKLCSVKGIDPKNAIPPGDEGEQGTDKESRIRALQAKLPTASATEKFRIASEIRKIREEKE